LVVVSAVRERKYFGLEFCKPACSFGEMHLSCLEERRRDRHSRYHVMIRLYSGRTGQAKPELIKQGHCGARFFDQYLSRLPLLRQLLDLGLEPRIIDPVSPEVPSAARLASMAAASAATICSICDAGRRQPSFSDVPVTNLRERKASIGQSSTAFWVAHVLAGAVASGHASRQCYGRKNCTR
jgi:hypothetical protein